MALRPEGQEEEEYREVKAGAVEEGPWDRRSVESFTIMCQYQDT